MVTTPSFSWLHLSDLHFGPYDNPSSIFQNLVSRRLIEDAVHQQGKLGKPFDALILTGDISSRGTDFEQATDFLNELKQSLGNN